MIEVKLSTHERVLKRNIEELRGIIEETSHELGTCVRAFCKICADNGHKIVPRNLNIDDQLKSNKFASTGAYCVVCGFDFGWWCPTSPIHVCMYSGQKCDVCGQIIGRGHKERLFHIQEKKHDASFTSIAHNSDRCVFCGMPEERK